MKAVRSDFMRPFFPSQLIIGNELLMNQQIMIGHLLPVEKESTIKI